MSKILIADDQNDVLEALRILLKGEGHQTDAMTDREINLNPIWMPVASHRKDNPAPN